MTENGAQTEQFTGLILLTGIDRPGIATALFECLAPFAVHIIDVEQVINNDRLILTVLIGANPAHQSAIEEDLNVCASTLDVDIATLFGRTNIPQMPRELNKVLITSPKLHPSSLALLTQSLTRSGANIESFARVSDTPVSIALTISGISKDSIESVLNSLSFDDQTTLSLIEL
jgi:phosphoserine phosphatase